MLEGTYLCAGVQHISQVEYRYIIKVTRALSQSQSGLEYVSTGAASNKNTRVDIISSKVVALGHEYNFQYRLHPQLILDDLKGCSRTVEIDLSPSKSRNPLFNPVMPVHALIANGINNSRCLLREPDPLVALFEHQAQRHKRIHC